MNNYRKILLDNLKGKEKTLIFDLHENGMLNMEAFGEFCEIAKSRISDMDNGVDNVNVIAQIYMLHAMLWKYIACHFDPNDGFRITNLSPDIYGEMIEELDDIFDVRKIT